VTSAFRCTYRLQLGPGLGFAEARGLVPYLARLGVSHLYLPPSFQARTGSTHGYDVVDPTSISEELGGEEAFRALVDEARAHGLGVILDIVPNHMATDERNRWWSDPSLRVRFFDVDPASDPEDPFYRRFFDIDHLAGVRQEDPEVFAETHRLALALVRDGLVDGLRIDHPDGMADPAGYLRRLADAGVQHIWVEKILSSEVDPPERLRPDWPVEGTVGYEFLNDVQGLFVDPAGEAPLTALFASVTGERRPFAEVAHEAKLEQAAGTFAREAAWLARLDPSAQDDVPALLAALPVYRTYDGGRSAEDREMLAHAGLEDLYAGRPAEWVSRFQQTTPPVMAKGVEDTAFYRYVRLLALNDVGGDPGRWGCSLARFHEANRARAAAYPRNLLITQTHDTKRSGDVRARIGALSLPGIAEAWCEAVPRWLELTEPLRSDRGAPDDTERLLVFQTLIGAWPIPADRLEAYLEKALREAKRTTTWVDQDHEWEDAVKAFGTALLTHEAFLAGFLPLAGRVAEAGHRSALAQTLLKLTVPGVPDVYQGDELVTLSLVDPDNRRPVDWERRRALLDLVLDGGRPDPAQARDAEKLSLIVRALRLRAERHEVFASGAYEPVDAGPDVCAFTRGGEVLVVAVLRDAGLDAAVDVPWEGPRGVRELTGGSSWALVAR
jgi:(1->4)-alpha-D-glucan 1-alpha-D-glucosylmutase